MLGIIWHLLQLGCWAQLANQDYANYFASYFMTTGDTKWRSIPEFYVSAGEETCFLEYLLKDVTLYSLYNVTTDAGVALPSCRVDIRNSKNRVLATVALQKDIPGGRGQRGAVSHTARRDYRVQICFRCDKGAWLGSGTAKVQLVNELLKDNEGKLLRAIQVDSKNTSNSEAVKTEARILENVTRALGNLEILFRYDQSAVESSASSNAALEDIKGRIRMSTSLTMMVTAVGAYGIFRSVKRFLTKENVI